MEIENQSTFISQMLQDLQAGVGDEETIDAHVDGGQRHTDDYG